MSHQRTILGDAPILHEISLQFQELCKRILEHLLVFLVPSLSGCHITKRQDIGCLADGGGPGDRMPVTARTAISIGVTHLRHKLVAHRYLKIRMQGEDAVESGCTAVHKLIRENQRTEGMLMLVRG